MTASRIGGTEQGKWVSDIPVTVLFEKLDFDGASPMHTTRQAAIVVAAVLWENQTETMGLLRTLGVGTLSSPSGLVSGARALSWRCSCSPGAEY